MHKKLSVILLLLTATVTSLGLAWGYTVYNGAHRGDMNGSSVLSDSEAYHGGMSVSGECGEETAGNSGKVSKSDSIESCEILSLPYDQIIYEKAQRYRVAPSLINALITIESNWDPLARSRSGAIGLMQLMPGTAREMGVHDPLNPVENIEGGVRYLRHLMDRFDGDLRLTIAAYNAGPRKIQVYKGIPPYRETQQYVKRVLHLYNSSGTSESI